MGEFQKGGRNGQGPRGAHWFAVYLLSSALTAWALAENRYAEAVSRVQDDRGQQVCSTGSYAFVRHPMYSAILMWCIAVAMVLPSVWVALVSAVVAAVIVVRTALEDGMIARGWRDIRSTNAAFAGSWSRSSGIPTMASCRLFDGLILPLSIS